MADYRITDIFGGGLRNVMRQSDAREKAEQDKLDELAKEERTLKATLAKEERATQREIDKEQRESNKEAAKKLEDTIYGAETLDKYKDKIISAVPEDKRDLLASAIEMSKASIASGSSNLEGEFDDLQSMVKDFNTKGDEFSRKVLKASNPELYAKVMAEEAMDKAAGGAALQRAKAQEMLERDYLRVSSTLDTTMDAAINFGEKQLENWGTKPGAYMGMVDKLTPDQWNEYKAAWRGAGNEGSATVGRFLIPGARGVGMTKVFAESAAQIGNTIAGNANNIAFSNGNLWATAVANNIMDIDQEGNPIRMQDAITVTGKDGKIRKLSELPLQERIAEINRLKHKFTQETARHIKTQAFLRNPNLLQKKTVVELTKNAPVYSSPTEVDMAIKAGKLMPGTLWKDKNGRLGVAR